MTARFNEMDCLFELWLYEFVIISELRLWPQIRVGSFSTAAPYRFMNQNVVYL